MVQIPTLNEQLWVLVAVAFFLGLIGLAAWKYMDKIMTWQEKQAEANRNWQQEMESKRERAQREIEDKRDEAQAVREKQWMEYMHLRDCATTEQMAQVGQQMTQVSAALREVSTTLQSHHAYVVQQFEQSKEARRF